MNSKTGKFVTTKPIYIRENNGNTFFSDESQYWTKKLNKVLSKLAQRPYGISIIFLNQINSERNLWVV